MAFTKAFRESTTLKICLAATLLLFYKFAVGGNDFGYGPNPVISAEGFGIAFTGIWAIWCNREWRKSKDK